MNGKRDDFVRADFYSLEEMVPSFSTKKIDEVIDRTIENVSQWPTLAKENEVPGFLTDEIKSNLRLKL